MKSIPTSTASSRLDQLLDETARSQQPVHLQGPRHGAVLVAEEDWGAMQETLYLLSVPGLRESIREGLATPLAETSEDPGW